MEKPRRPRDLDVEKRREHMQLLLSDHANVSNMNDYYHPNKIVKTESYALFYDYLKDDKADDLLQETADLGISFPSSEPIDIAGFALRVMLTGSSYTLSDENRSKYAVELRYAYEHAVVPMWLPPFILQAGGYEKIVMKIKLGQRESWLFKTPLAYPTNLSFPAPKRASSARRNSPSKSSE